MKLLWLIHGLMKLLYFIDGHQRDPKLENANKSKRQSSIFKTTYKASFSLHFLPAASCIFYFSEQTICILLS